MLNSILNELNDYNRYVTLGGMLEFNPWKNRFQPVGKRLEIIVAGLPKTHP